MRIPTLHDEVVLLDAHTHADAARGRGHATRAVDLLCSYLRDNELATAAVIRADPENPASIAVAERAGFVHHGTITTRDGHTFVVLRRALADVRAAR